MFTRIRTKYFLIGSIFFCIAAVAFYMYHSNLYLEQKSQSINLLAEKISNRIFNKYKSDLKDTSNLEIEFVSSFPETVSYYVITDEAGKIIKNSNMEIAKKNDYLNTAVNKTLDINKNILRKIYTSKLNEKSRLTLYLGLMLPGFDKEVAANLRFFGVISLILFLTGSIFSFLLGNIIYMPVKKILNAADSLVGENFSSRISSKRKDEYGVLFKKFNRFAGKFEITKTQIDSLNRQVKNLFRDKIEELNFEINQRKNLEKDLKQSEEQFRLLVELAPVGMVLTSPENKITKVNLSFCETVGYTSEELIGKSISDITDKDDWAKELFLHKRLLKNKVDDLADWPESTEEDWEQKLALNKKMLTDDLSDIYFEKRFIHKNGKIIYAIVKSILLRDAKDNPVSFVSQVIDITERKLVEKELILAKNKAEASDRLKSAFLAQMSHEIRTPLNVILNVTPIVAEELATLKDEELNTLMESMDSAGRRLQRTIDLILNLSSIQSGNYEAEFEVIDVAKQIESMTKELKPLCNEKGLELYFISEASSSLISADTYTFNQIFQNLLGNAIKYTPKGHIEIKISEDGDNKIHIAVKDTGIGISEDYLKRIYTPFSQEDIGQKREFEGNGLGLALVKKYVEVNHAEIKVESAKGVGSTFTVIFNKENLN